MASGGGGAPGASGSLGASSPLPPCPRCAAPARALVASGAHGGGDLRGAVREVYDRLFADDYPGLVSAPSCVGASSLPPPPRRATSPPGRCASCVVGGDLRYSLREMFECLISSGFVESVASSPPPPPRCVAPLGAVVSPCAHGGADLGGYIREVFDRLFADGYLGVVSAAPCLGPSSLPPPPPPRYDAPPPAVVASDGRGGGDFRDPLRKLFERLVADSYVHMASPAPASPFRFCTIDIGQFRASYLLNTNAQNSKATLLISQKDMAESCYPQGRSVFHHDYPRIQELNADGTKFNAHQEADDLSDALSPFITKPKLSAQPSSVIGLKSQKAHVYTTTNLNSAIRDFDHAINAQLIGSCTSMPQFGLSTDYTPRRSQFYSLQHDHATRTDRRMTHEVLTCRQCETSAATIKCLLRLNSLIEQKLEELSENNIAAVQNTKISGDDTLPLEPELQLIGSRTSAPQLCVTIDNMPGLHSEHEVIPPKPEPDHPAEDSVRNLKGAIKAGERCDKQTSEDNAAEPNSLPNRPDTESVGNFQEEKVMEKFNMPGLHSEHEVSSPKSEPEHPAEDSVRNLKRAIKAGERCDKQTSEDNPAEPNSLPNRPDTESLGNFQEEKVMENFNMPGLQSEHEVSPPKSEPDHPAEDSVRNLKGAIKEGERCDKQTSEDNPAEPNSPPNPPDTESVGNFQEEKLMEKFNKLLVDCVSFAVPQVLIFFPRYQASEEKAEQRLSLLAIIQQTDNQSNEKVVVIFLFVMFVSAWLLGLVLSLFGRGSRFTTAVSILTLLTVGSTVAFIDYMLCKCLPEAGLVTWLFRGHFAAMVVMMAYIWCNYVHVLKFPSISLPSCQGVFYRLRGRRKTPVAAVDGAEEKDELKKILLLV